MINIGRLFMLAIIGIMAVAFVVIFIIKLGDKKPTPVMLEWSRLAFWLSGLGLPAFLLGMVLGILPEFGHVPLGIGLAVGGFLTAFASIFLNAVQAKSKRKAWPVVPARCTEQQLQKKWFGNPEEFSEGWLWRVVCEIDYGGKNYVVSPKVHWSDMERMDAPFCSEEKAQQFISLKISPKGECKLRVNPNNPLEAELL